MQLACRPHGELVTRAARVVHGRTGQRHEGNDIDHTKTRMFTSVLMNRQQVDRGARESPWSFGADEGVDASVVVRIGMAIEKIGCAHVVEVMQNAGIAALAHVDDALEHEATLSSGTGSGAENPFGGVVLA